MRRVRAGKRGRWISLLAAGLVGYLLGGWHAANNRSTELTAAQSVALRFPEASAGTAIERSATEMPTGTVSATALKDARLALLSPQPMAPIASALPAQPQAAAPPPLPPETPAPTPTPFDRIIFLAAARLPSGPRRSARAIAPAATFCGRL
jgi:hypothetical protein